MILQRADREQLQAMAGCMKMGLPYRFSRMPGDPEECHVGTVEWCEIAMGRHPRPDYYPSWLRGRMCRWVLESQRCDAAFPMFGKPRDRYKSATPKIIQAGEQTNPTWIYTEVVRFTQEWRYYVAAGEVLAAGWYDGDNEDEPAPWLGIEWPKGWCGAADFGRLYPSGEIALVECHHPYACGNYLESDECELWAMWLQLGWEWMLDSAANSE